MRTVLGVIGGSGLYDLPGIAGCEWRPVATPWGQPSDQILFAALEGLPLRFLPRHGRGHRLPPGAIDYRANIDALKRAGVTDLISFSACGSLREDLAPGAFVLVDQFVDRTVARPSSFFGEGLVAHVAMADPVSPGLLDRVSAAAEAEDIEVVRGGTYLAIEGPQFSTRAESQLYRQWGCDVIGMTNMPEARLAREAELCYATIAMVTDYDCWRAGEVSVPEILRIMSENIARARRLLSRLVADFPREHPPCPIGSDRALEHAIITAPEKRDPALMAKLDAVAGRVLSRG
jgi:5'-methylthioadenosine phosphorylase